jgi:DNA-binding NarL/FixJ family response regulator
MGLIRTLLVDDSPEFLEASQRFLASNPQIEIIATANSGQESIQLVSKLHPDLVLMDLAMPGLNGLEATRQIKTLSNPPLVIILTLHDNFEYQIASESVQAKRFYHQI